MDRKILDDTFASERLDLIIALDDQTRLWYTGFSSSAGYLFIYKKDATLLIDGRYFEAAQKHAKNATVQLLTKANLQLIQQKVAPKRLGIMSDYLTVDELVLIKAWFPHSEIINVSGKKLRMVKSADEIAKVEKACHIALEALELTLPMIKPGHTTERMVEIALETKIKELGADKGSFDFIVASGHRGSLPHGRASDKIINAGELLTIDYGAYYQGYASDITRTMTIGKVDDKQLLKIQEILTAAQRLAVDAVKPGVSTNEIDKVARDYITARGFGEYFVHSTGHGLGIDVHEKPTVSSNPDTNITLAPGMIITVEPGIYLPGVGGIRIEDDVLVTPSGHRVLSQRK